ncbi:hypothetical protein TSUD_383480 [Trifolium subterraneum]|uniref:Uncharacterized protein n=1 Tax=Trifolium subterraneum TaxID=3900 RepID=A0A2Z6NW27_TRISU|nr:hypothetical protein TSUD_383480 [Trifolium subterraneum]
MDRCIWEEKWMVPAQPNQRIGLQTTLLSYAPDDGFAASRDRMSENLCVEESNANSFNYSAHVGISSCKFGLI